VDTWRKETTSVTISEEKFSEGAFREAWKAYMYLTPEGKDSDVKTEFVVKFAIDTSTPRSVYMNDVFSEKVARNYADKWNAQNPPYPVHFVNSFVLELVDRPRRPFCGAEAFIEGEFKKHNNNLGAVCSQLNATPQDMVEADLAQAFSHFSYERSDRSKMVCDIQGCPGMYTDPQIHSLSGKGFGAGNLGRTGIKAFLLRHKCNQICRQMKLTKINPHTIEEELASREREMQEQEEVNRRKQGNKPTRAQVKRPQNSSSSSLSSSSSSSSSSKSSSSSSSSSSARKPVRQQQTHSLSSDRESKESGGYARAPAAASSATSRAKHSVFKKQTDDDDEDFMNSILDMEI
jgi:elongation factor 2 kinase